MKKGLLKRYVVALPLVALVCACTPKRKLELTVTNHLSVDRTEEIVEIPLSDISEKVEFTYFSLKDAAGKEVTYQLTSDKKLIFPATVGANASAKYTLVETKYQPVGINSQVYGRQFPERDDDMAWENDKGGYRIYGPALQARGEKGFGQDIFLKRVEEPILERIYAMALNPDTQKEMKRLRADGQKERADSLDRATSYHYDHGLGMDCYLVGPTLGACTPALLVDSAIVYPYCYKKYEVLDNGPLRFKVKLTFRPSKVGSDNRVVETRVISLDKGSCLNKTAVSYRRLSAPTPVVAGISLRTFNPNGYAYDAEQGYIAYEDLTSDPNNGNGVVYVGALVQDSFEHAGVQLFPEANGTAIGHLLGGKTYEPHSAFVYYWGHGWSKRGFTDMKSWIQYLKDYRERLSSPLEVSF